MRSFNVVSFPRKRESRARHARPSLDARFRGHDTDVSESSPHFERLTRLGAVRIARSDPDGQSADNRALKSRLQRCAPHTAEAGAGIPARAGGIADDPFEGIVRRARRSHDIAKGAARESVEDRVDEADRMAEIRIYSGQETRVQRRDGARSPDRLGRLAANDFRVAAVFARVAGDVGNASPRRRRSNPFGHIRAALIARRGKAGADAAARGAGPGGSDVVPDIFVECPAIDVADRRAPASEDPWFGRRVTRLRAGLIADERPRIARRNENGDAQLGGILEELTNLGERGTRETAGVVVEFRIRPDWKALPGCRPTG